MKRTFSKLKIYLIIFCFAFTSSTVFAKEAKNVEKREFTINYDNVSIIEYINFISKLTGFNFVYEPQDLNFGVTIVSEEPITKDSLMSTLIQVLRIHNLFVTEDGNNLIISKSTDVRELAQVVTSLDEMKDPIVTRVFQIKNAKVATVASVIRPMISTSALLETSIETKQLIITDITTNIRKIEELISKLDLDENPLKVGSYNVKMNTPGALIELTDKIMTPLTVGNSFILVTQESSGMVYIVSTPALVKKTLSILEALDVPPQKEIKTYENQNIFIYKPEYRTAEDLKNSLDKIALNLKDSGFPESGLVESIDTMRWIRDTHSFTFSGTEDTISRIKQIMKDLDTPIEKSKKSQQTYFLYKLKNVSGEQVEEDLDALVQKLKDQEIEDPKLLGVLESAKWIKETNSILLTGNPAAIDEVKTIIQHYDFQRPGTIKGNFLMFTPKHVSLDAVEKSLKDISNNLLKSGLADKSLITAIKTMRAVDSTNSLVFTGDDLTLGKIQNLLNSIDVSTSTEAIQKLGRTNFWVYKVQNARPLTLVSSLKSIIDDLSSMNSTDKKFIQALKSMKYVKETRSLVFTGNSEALEKIKPLVEKFDIKIDKDKAEPTTYFVYRPKYLKGPALENILGNFAEQIKVTGVENEALYETIESMKWSDQTRSLVFTGEIQAIEELKALLDTFDIPDKDHPSTHEISGLENLGFLVYKLQYHKGAEIEAALKEIASDLKTTEGKAATKFKLIKTIDSIQWIKVTNSLLCSGDKETLGKMKELVGSLDVPLKQVFIEVLIIQTTLTNALTFGLDWGAKFQYKNRTAIGMGNFQDGSNAFANTLNGISSTVTPKGSDIPLGGGFDLGIIGDILMHKGRSFLSLGSLLQAIQTDTETTIVMTPKIIGQDGKTSKLFSGSNVPYSGSVVQNQSGAGNAGSTLITTNLEYRDIGVQLTITPILGNSDTVSLTIELESSSQDSPGANVSSLGQVVGITTSKTILNTSVHIPNKHFLVISGIVKDTKTRAKQGIPCLGGLPIIGAAFAKDTKQDTRNNIVIFIRPHIINSFKDMKHVTEVQEDFFREQTGKPSLERDYDEATELIKAYDDE